MISYADVDGDDQINKEELRDALREGEKLTDDEVQDMIDYADVAGDGRLNYEELILRATASSTTRSS